jgi:hypothetical protein
MLFGVCTANAVEIRISKDSNVRSVTVSDTATFIQLRPDTPTLAQVSGTGAGIFKATVAQATPTSFSGFTPDPDGSVSSNTSWVFPAGLGYVGFDVTSGTWVVTVAQPR